MEAFYRQLYSIDWVFLLYVIAFLLLLTAKKYSDYKFVNFCRLILTNTYLKTYKDDSIYKPFHVTIVIYGVLISPLIITTFLYEFGQIKQFNIIEYVKVLAFVLLFVFFKFIVQLIIGFVLRIKQTIKSYVFKKQTYFSYLTFLSSFPLLFLIFTPEVNVFIVYLFLFLYVALFLLSVFLVITRFKDLFFRFPLYFILYLCTFEIAPFVIGFYIIEWL